VRVVVTGLIAQHPRLGGVAWDYVQYPVGLALLGHDVYYLEDSGEWPYRLDGGSDPDSWIARDPAANVRHLADVMRRFGLEDRWMYRFALDGRWYGMRDRRREAVLASADLLLNVSGTLEHPDRYRRIPRLAYIDSDPVFTQARLVADREAAFAGRVAAHDVHFSFGERVNDGPFRTRHTWRPTRQPVVLPEWRVAQAPRDAFTTVMSWTSYPPFTIGGVTLAQKDVEFGRLIGLPRRTAAPLEVALGSVHHAGWESEVGALAPEVAAQLRRDPSLSPARLLSLAGWRVVDALQACATMDAYRAYVGSSRAELSVAKSGYVVGRAGWFSCRSACYLASGRPVVVQDTGFSPAVPSGEGVLAFDTPDAALAAINEVVAHPRRHARAAREIAAEYFAADRVLAALLDAAMTSDRQPGTGTGA
jgi:hypothetical protein